MYTKKQAREYIEESLQEQQQGTRQECKTGRKEVGKRVCKKSCKELGKRDCSKMIAVHTCMIPYYISCMHVCILFLYACMYTFPVCTLAQFLCLVFCLHFLDAFLPISLPLFMYTFFVVPGFVYCIHSCLVPCYFSCMHTFLVPYYYSCILSFLVLSCLPYIFSCLVF